MKPLNESESVMDIKSEIIQSKNRKIARLFSTLEDGGFDLPQIVKIAIKDEFTNLANDMILIFNESEKTNGTKRI